MNPRVSVLIPYYNDERFLCESIESVLSQGFADFELVLVNHASTDGSRAIARSFGDPRIVHVDMPVNHGAGGGLVVAEFLKVARGEYVKFFCADDVMGPDGLERLVRCLESRPDMGFAFGNVRYVDVLGKPMGADWFSDRGCRSEATSEVECLRLLARPLSFLPWIGSIMRRILLEKVELDMTAVMTFDISLWADLLLGGVRIGFLDDIVADYRIHPGQMSAVGRRQEHLQRVELELQTYFRRFMDCGIETAKQIFIDDRWVQSATSEEVVRAAVALHFLEKLPACASWAYLYLRDCLQHEAGRESLSSELGLSVAEFRRIVGGVVEPRRHRSRWVRFRDKWLRRRKRGDDGPVGFSL